MAVASPLSTSLRPMTPNRVGLLPLSERYLMPKEVKEMKDVLGRVKAIIEEQLGIDMEAKARELGVSIEALRFREDLEADSLDLVELIMAFEEEFGGEISDEEAQGITTVGEAVAYLEEYLAKEGEAS